MNKDSKDMLWWLATRILAGFVIIMINLLPIWLHETGFFGIYMFFWAGWTQIVAAYFIISWDFVWGDKEAKK